MLKRPSMVQIAVGTLVFCWPAHAGGLAADTAALRQQVAETERAFARTMADRDHDAFMTFISGEAVFIMGESTLRGKAQVGEGWKRFYDGPKAPFSWEPDQVEVLDSGSLAFSAGPVYGPDGTRVGTFNSVWRLEADGRWRIIFDKGCPPCK